MLRIAYYSDASSLSLRCSHVGGNVTKLPRGCWVADAGRYSAFLMPILFPGRRLELSPAPAYSYLGRDDNRSVIGQLHNNASQLTAPHMDWTPKRARLVRSWLGPYMFGVRGALVSDSLGRTFRIDLKMLLDRRLLLVVLISVVCGSFGALLSRAPEAIWLGSPQRIVDLNSFILGCILSGIFSSHLTLIFNAKARLPDLSSREKLLVYLQSDTTARVHYRGLLSLEPLTDPGVGHDRLRKAFAAIFRHRPPQRIAERSLLLLAPTDIVLTSGIVVPGGSTTPYPHCASHYVRFRDVPGVLSGVFTK